jgi:hypothetical protein
MVGLLRPSAGVVEAFGKERRTERDFHEVRTRAGLLFQVVDDILDCTASTATLGKTAGKDEAAAKPTGVKWVDAWNGSIRPSYATVALFLWLVKVGAGVQDGRLRRGTAGRCGWLLLRRP